MLRYYLPTHLKVTRFFQIFSHDRLSHLTLICCCSLSALFLLLRLTSSSYIIYFSFIISYIFFPHIIFFPHFLLLCHLLSTISFLTSSRITPSLTLSFYVFPWDGIPINSLMQLVYKHFFLKHYFIAILASLLLTYTTHSSWYHSPSKVCPELN